MQASERGGTRGKFRSHMPEGHGLRDSKRKELWMYPHLIEESKKNQYRWQKTERGERKTKLGKPFSNWEKREFQRWSSRKPGQMLQRWTDRRSNGQQIYYSFFNHFCMAQPVVSKLLHVIDFKKWFPVGILRYRIYYGKIYIWQHSVYYSVPLHCSQTQWKMFTVVSNTLFQEEETQGNFLR